MSIINFINTVQIYYLLRNKYEYGIICVNNGKYIWM